MSPLWQPQCLYTGDNPPPTYVGQWVLPLPHPLAEWSSQLSFPHWQLPSSHWTQGSTPGGLKLNLVQRSEFKILSTVIVFILPAAQPHTCMTSPAPLPILGRSPKLPDPSSHPSLAEVHVLQGAGLQQTHPSLTSLACPAPSHPPRMLSSPLPQNGHSFVTVIIMFSLMCGVASGR